MDRNPYKITGPATINTSGGRTSAFMLRMVMDAHGGKLPDDVVPLFMNTGLEHEATYVFLKDLEERWSPGIRWLELAHDGGPRFGFREVDYCTASRAGEPFTALIKKRKMLPNPVARFCTSELKIRTVQRWCQAQGWEEWDTAVGLRADEPRRAGRIKGDVKSENVVLPMFEAGHTAEDVLEFWKGQEFDLNLPGGDNRFGNCVGCFLKGRKKLDQIMRTNPEHFTWWKSQEEEGTYRLFRYDRPSYRQMMTQLSVQGQMFDDAIEDDTQPCMCHD